ncbi:uncharacterized protein FOMMEDRAFT_152727 [Fomitiporia mediterranea MF3/22]|uniref:uncharacterized protein n=1 Tax=Fomitiporia mediterranea (strain MF3/22) TaxID=694068 RepID=UPI0004409459|nr:uncharacterized protein FOMMEDRAFT_152727 [Fomitiporia mediterranea MF3/22]EJD05420.1 hypothetical protein FOMMEDRAFT_152727 [Fomitiporia mediterranea MF3/22]
MTQTISAVSSISNAVSAANATENDVYVSVNGELVRNTLDIMRKFVDPSVPPVSYMVSSAYVQERLTPVNEFQDAQKIAFYNLAKAYLSANPSLSSSYVPNSMAIAQSAPGFIANRDLRALARKHNEKVQEGMRILRARTEEHLEFVFSVSIDRLATARRGSSSVDLASLIDIRLPDVIPFEGAFATATRRYKEHIAAAITDYLNDTSRRRGYSTAIIKQAKVFNRSDLDPLPRAETRHLDIDIEDITDDESETCVVSDGPSGLQATVTPDEEYWGNDNPPTLEVLRALEQAESEYTSTTVQAGSTVGARVVRDEGPGRRQTISNRRTDEVGLDSTQAQIVQSHGTIVIPAGYSIIIASPPMSNSPDTPHCLSSPQSPQSSQSSQPCIIIASPEASSESNLSSEAVSTEAAPTEVAPTEAALTETVPTASRIRRSLRRAPRTVCSEAVSNNTFGV